MASLDLDVPASVSTCGTCGYRGDGMPYFRRTEHAALLVGAALVTYGVGGFVYWMVRRDAWACPGCGATWLRSSAVTTAQADAERAIQSHRGESPPYPHERLPHPHEKLPAGGFLRRILGTIFAIAGSSLLVIAATEASGVALAFAVALGLSGILLFVWGRRAQERRREGLLLGLQNRALHLARARSGRLTATEAAAELRLTVPAAERVLFSMDDGFRIRSEITREGLLVFDFPELRHGALGEAGTGLGPSRDLA